MSIVFENCRLDFCHLTTPVYDAYKKSDLCKALVKIPNTPENREAFDNEVQNAIDYGAANKAKVLAGKFDPIAKLSEDLVTPDGQWIAVNISSSKPFTVYNRYGEEMDNCDVKHIDNAQVEIFGFVWCMPEMKRWGVKPYARAICISDDIEQSSNVGKFKFQKRNEPIVADNPLADDMDREDEYQTRRSGGLKRRRVIK